MKKIFYVLVAIVIIGFAGYFMFKDSNGEEPKSIDTQQDADSNDSDKEGKIVDKDILMDGAVATLYYGDGCPHCTNIEKWLTENGYLPKKTPVTQPDVDSWISNAKVKFNIKEVWYNKSNSAELSKVAAEAGLKENEVGVPLLYDSTNKKSYIGETDIKKFFQSK